MLNLKIFQKDTGWVPVIAAQIIFIHIGPNPSTYIILDASQLFTAFLGDFSLSVYLIPEVRIQKHCILLCLLQDQFENADFKMGQRFLQLFIT